MALKEEPKVLDKEAIARTLERIAHEILEHNKEVADVVIIGIRTRGVYLAERLKGYIKKICNVDVPVGILDITLYRDDLSQVAEQPVVHATEIDFDISRKKVVLVDDVLFTSRTIRCALDALIDLGRPKNIQLAVLVDRGHRELPIRADYVGKNIPTALNEIVEVHLVESDGADEVLLVRK